jgi:hypothetical protein
MAFHDACGEAIMDAVWVVIEAQLARAYRSLKASLSE